MPALIGPMSRALLLSGLSTGCGFAALGVALYGQSPQMVAGGLIFGGVGFVTGVVLMALPMAFNGLPAQARLAAGQVEGETPSPLAAMARATLAAMKQPPRRDRATQPEGAAPAAADGMAAPAEAPAAKKPGTFSDTVGA